MYNFITRYYHTTRRTVFVPYCSSDMWLGNASNSSAGFHFRGRAIATAVLQDLATTTFTPVSIPTECCGPGPNNTRLANATQLVVAGNAGVMRMLESLGPIIPAKPRQQLKAICDGCLIIDQPPFVDTDQEPCGSSAATCPASDVLRKGVALWNTEVQWNSVMASSLLSRLANLPIPCLVQFPQFEKLQLKQNRAWPVTSKTRGYVESWGAAARAALRARPNQSLYTFSVACSPNSSSFLLDHDNFLCRPASCQMVVPRSTHANGDGVINAIAKANATGPLKLTAMTSMFLNDPSYQPSCIDDCGGVDCNEYCNEPLCWG